MDVNKLVWTVSQLRRCCRNVGLDMLYLIKPIKKRRDSIIGYILCHDASNLESVTHSPRKQSRCKRIKQAILDLQYSISTELKRLAVDRAKWKSIVAN